MTFLQVGLTGQTDRRKILIYFREWSRDVIFCIVELFCFRAVINVDCWATMTFTPMMFSLYVSAFKLASFSCLPSSTIWEFKFKFFFVILSNAWKINKLTIQIVKNQKKNSWIPRVVAQQRFVFQVQHLLPWWDWRDQQHLERKKIF